MTEDKNEFAAALESYDNIGTYVTSDGDEYRYENWAWQYDKEIHKALTRLAHPQAEGDRAKALADFDDLMNNATFDPDYAGRGFRETVSTIRAALSTPTTDIALLKQRAAEWVQHYTGGNALIDFISYAHAEGYLAEPHHLNRKEQSGVRDSVRKSVKLLLSEPSARVCELLEVIADLADTLDKLACLGNGPVRGNSVGNCMAIDAVEKHAAIIEQSRVKS